MAHTGKRRPKGSGQVTRLTRSGRYQARGQNADGTTALAPQTFAYKGEAEAWLDEFNRAKAAGSTAALTAHTATTLHEFGSELLAKRRLEPRTRADYLKRWAVVDAALGHRPLQSITLDDVQRFWDSLNHETPVMTEHIYSVLRVVMTTAVKRGKIGTNPCTVEGTGVDTTRDVDLATPEQIATMVDTINKRYRIAIWLAAYCGLRFGEITELRRKDVTVDYANGVVVAVTIRVRRGVTRVDGEYHVGGPKSDAGKRLMIVPEPVWPFVVGHLAEHVDEGKDALLLPASRDRSKHLAPSSWCKVWYRARAAAGRSDLHFHDLRHFGGTNVASVPGIAPADIMRWLGHSTWKATMRYLQAVNEKQTTIADALGSVVVVPTSLQPEPVALTLVQDDESSAA